MKLGVIDYGASNLGSVCNALLRLGQSFEVVSSPEGLDGFNKLILPGVGAAGRAMEALRERGFDKALPFVKVPLLGICLGLQLLSEWSDENETPCLGMFPGRVSRFPEDIKSPQVGWNQVEIMKVHPIFQGIPNPSFFYFVQSYYYPVKDPYTLGKSMYGLAFSSVIQRENFFGVQFHPEKSGEAGLRLLLNFCRQC